MITMVSVPKAFRGHIDTIQTNAIESWIRLKPPCQVVLFGDEPGIAEKAARYGLQHVPEVALSECGTPLLNSVLEKARVLSVHNLICYVNADIILMSDLIRAIERWLARSRTAFLLAGGRWDIDLEEPLDFGDPNWEWLLMEDVRQRGRQRPPQWIDYFVFPRDLFKEVPPFTIGRALFDNWLLWKARSLGAALVDASEVVLATHQNHDYSHHAQGQQGVWDGREARLNLALMGTWRHCYTLAHATHRITPSAVKRNLKWSYFSTLLKLARITLIEWMRIPLHWLGLMRSTEERFRAE